MKILFLGDVVGISGCSKIMNSLKSEIEKNDIDFVILNGENSSGPGVGININTCKDFFNCGVDVITTGNHVWDQKEIMNFIENEKRLLRPKNFFEPSLGIDLLFPVSPKIVIVMFIYFIDDVKSPPINLTLNFS